MGRGRQLEMAGSLRDEGNGKKEAKLNEGLPPENRRRGKSGRTGLPNKVN